MCGRFVSSHTPAQLAEHFAAIDATGGDVSPDYNVAPTKSIPAVIKRVDDDGNEQRQLKLFRWGLIPSWAKDPSIGNKMINARVETARTKPAFRSAFAKRRCIIPVSGFYEWQVTDDGKQPWFIYAPDGSPLAFAGLFEKWKDAEGRVMSSCTIITTSACDDVGELHDRAPMVVPDDAWEDWLDPASDVDALSPLLVPAVPGTFAAHKVDKAVGNVRNNYAELVEPVPTGV